MAILKEAKENMVFKRKMESNYISCFETVIFGCQDGWQGWCESWVAQVVSRQVLLSKYFLSEIVVVFAQELGIILAESLWQFSLISICI